jgi:hypothetical protein
MPFIAVMYRHRSKAALKIFDQKRHFLLGKTFEIAAFSSKMRKNQSDFKEKSLVAERF